MGKTYTNVRKEWYPHTKPASFFACTKEESGYMTVFASLLFFVMSAVLLLCLDGCLIYQAKARCTTARTGLSEHLLANYNVPLSKRYDLYFLDPRMGEEELRQRGMDYLNTLWGADTSSMWNMETDSLKIEAIGTLQEKECRYFMDQIKESMKNNLVKDMVFEMLGISAQERERLSRQVEESAGQLDQKEEAAQENTPDADDILMPSETAMGVGADDNARNKSPLNRLKNMLHYGVMGLVTDESSLSNQYIQAEVLPFPNLKEKGMTISISGMESLKDIKNILTEQNMEHLTKSTVDRSMLCLYIKKHFNYYNRQDRIPDTVLSYETEYILGGQNSDKENLEYVINRMVLLRFAFNSIYGFGDPQLREQAWALAAMLTGVTGTPEFIEAVRYVILSAVSMIESITDVEQLMQGKSVPLLKNKATWRTSVQGKSGNADNKGSHNLAYEDYLCMLVLLHGNSKNLSLRMQNLMQINIQKEEPFFQIKECRAGVTVQTGIRSVSRFYFMEHYFEEKENYFY